MTDSDQNLMLSIIVPVYNVATYVRECMESFQGQDYTGPREIILIDDCSTDGSLDICRQFASDPASGFRLIENPVNAGVSVSRNHGLDQARGRYIMFVDPDDLLPTDAFTHMVEAAEQFNADIVKGNLTLFNVKGERPARDRVGATTLIEGSAVLTALFQHSKVRGHIGGKLFRRSSLGDIRFTTGVRMAQDLLYFSEMFSRARSLVLLDKAVYRYRKHRGGSTGRKYEKGSYIDWLDSVENSGKFATTDEQRRAHKALMLRTMAQIARESREITPEYAARVLSTIEERCQRWNIRLAHLISKDRLGPRSIMRYLRMRLAIDQSRRKLSRARGG